MLKYQQKRSLKSVTAASATVPVLPAFQQGHPSVDVVIYRWFDNNGDYLGWTNEADGKKFLIGKLYYKTKGAYFIRTRRDYNNIGVRKVYVYEKSSNNLALYAIKRALKPGDLIDLENKKGLLKMTAEQVQNHVFSAWNYSDYPDPYKILPASMRQKFVADMQNFLKQKHEEVLETIKALELDIDRAEAVNASSTAATKGEWDFEGLSS